MAASRFSVGPVQLGVAVLVLGLAGCDDGPARGFALPSAPTPPPTAGTSPAPAPVPPPGYPVPPVPTRFGPLVYTPLEIGTVARGPIVDPPECVDERGWPCLYFLVTAPVSGRLEAVVTYSAETQGGQGVDLTVRDSEDGGEVWAQIFRPNVTGVEAAVRAGRTYHLVMRYTFNGLEFELATSLKPE